MIERVVVAFGESDCETIGSGFLAQPVNAVSSLAFSLFGVVVLLTLARGTGRERVNRIVFGLLMVATGVGSFLFHGPQGPFSHFLHDITFITTVFAVAIMNVERTTGRSSRVVFAILGGVSAAVAACLILWPESTNLLAGTAVITFVVADIVLHRTGYPRSGWWIASVATMVLAVISFTFGRTGGPLCDADSLFQGHALWHLLVAAALWIYFEATTPARMGAKT